MWFYLLLNNKNKQTKTPNQTSKKKIPKPSGYRSEKQLGKFRYSFLLSYFGVIEMKGKSESSTEFLLTCRVEILL